MTRKPAPSPCTCSVNLSFYWPSHTVFTCFALLTKDADFPVPVGVTTIARVWIDCILPALLTIVSGAGVAFGTALPG